MYLIVYCNHVQHLAGKLLKRILDIRFILLLYTVAKYLLLSNLALLASYTKNISLYRWCLVGKPEQCNAVQVRRKWLSSHYVLLRIKVH